MGRIYRALAVALLGTFFVAGAALAQEKVTVPSAGSPVPVVNISQEYVYLARERCTCGARYRPVGQVLMERDGKHYDRLGSTTIG